MHDDSRSLFSRQHFLNFSRHSALGSLRTRPLGLSFVMALCGPAEFEASFVKTLLSGLLISGPVKGCRLSSLHHLRNRSPQPRCDCSNSGFARRRRQENSATAFRAGRSEFAVVQSLSKRPARRDSGATCRIREELRSPRNNHIAVR